MDTQYHAVTSTPNNQETRTGPSNSADLQAETHENPEGIPSHQQNSHSLSAERLGVSNQALVVNSNAANSDPVPPQWSGTAPGNASISADRSSSQSPIPRTEKLKPGTASSSGSKSAFIPKAVTWLSKFQQSWIPELLSLLLSGAALVALIILLGIYDSRPLPPWTQTISLNSAISWLGTVASIGATYAATQGLSQVKWVLFSQDKRRLCDMRTFDSASRGIFGAIELLLHIRARQFPIFGTLAVILVVAFDPFVQNLVHFYDGQRTSSFPVASVGRNFIYDSHGAPYMHEVYDVDEDFKANVYAALLQPNQSQTLDPMFSCPAGNCTWDPFETLAFCPICNDVTNDLYKRCVPVNSSWSQSLSHHACEVVFPQAGNATWPPTNLTYVDGKAVGPNKFMIIDKGELIGKNRPGNKACYPFQYILMDIDPFSLGDGENHLTIDTKFIGTECAIDPCVQRINASVRDGTYSEEVLDVWRPFDSIEHKGDYNTSQLVSPWKEGPDQEQNQVFGLTGDSHNAIHMRSVIGASSSLQGYVTENDGRFGVSFRATDIDNPFLPAIFYSDFHNTTCPHPRDKFFCTFRALANAMTKAVRDAPIIANGTNSPRLGIGKSQVTTTFVRVSWGWIGQPATVWLLSAVIWLGTVWKSRRRKLPFWRDNVLPLMFILREGSGPATGDQDGELEIGVEEIVDEHGNNSILMYTQRAEATTVRLESENGRLILSEKDRLA